MNRTDIEKEIIRVISEIQSSSGLECPRLDGESLPASDVPEFSSPIWIAATTMIARKIGVQIPEDVNLFYDKEKETEKSIAEIVDTLLDLIAESEDVGAVK